MPQHELVMSSQEPKLGIPPLLTLHNEFEFYNHKNDQGSAEKHFAEFVVIKSQSINFYVY